MRFVKMHGTGNDYIYINLFEGYDDSVSATYDAEGNLTEIEGKPVKDVVVKVSDRHFGIGSDGLIAIAPSETCDVRMIMYNLDGSEGAMCGNGIRCVAKFAYDRGIIENTRNQITVQTASGNKELTLTIEDGLCTYVEVNMGQAILFPAQIPVDVSYIGGFADRAPGESGRRTRDKDIFNNLLEGNVYGGEDVSAIVSRRLQASGREYAVTCVSMGNPHCVIFTDGIDDLDLEKLGPRFENHPAFPERINTEFVEVIDDHTLKMRVWERGSGETMSCGTGTCAVTVAAVLNGYVVRGKETEIRIRGGSLYDTWLESGEVRMRGPAEVVFEGEITL